jgi:hypothetical protein
MTDERSFVKLTEAQMNEGDVWLDVDQVIAVHELKDMTLVYLADTELAFAVKENGTTVMDRMADAAARAVS